MPNNTANTRHPADPQLLHLYNRLYKHFGPRHWWPADTPWEMMVGAILTQNTAWTNVEKALASLKNAKALSVGRISQMPRRRLEKLIRSSGFFRQKAVRLQSVARAFQRDPVFFKQLSCQAKGNLPDLRRRLLAMNGIGPETADSMLLYAGGYPIFVVDAYTRRISQRQGFFHSDKYLEVQAYFEERLPKKAALYNEYHALLVGLAKNYCKSRNPLCETCPVNASCVYAKKNK